jgi:sporulation protein YlmC with PRC-barrel domain
MAFTLGFKPAEAETPAPVAGGSVIGVTVSEIVVLANGWSAKKQILGHVVFNDKNEKVGKVYDIIIAPDKAVSYGIIAAGGFLGVAKHDVAIPASQFKMQDGKIVLPGATKDAIKAMPAFQYAK